MKRPKSHFLLVPAIVFMIIGLFGLGGGVAVMVSRALGWEQAASFLIAVCVVSWVVMAILWFYLMGMKVLAWVGIVQEERDT